MTRIELSVAAFISITAGCVTSHQPAVSGLSPVSPAAVQVFMDGDEPGRPYVSIGRFTVERSRLPGDGEDPLLRDARDSAAEMGAHAILVTSIPESAYRTRLAGKSSGTGGGDLEVTHDERPALDVTAVVWTCGNP